MKTVSAFFALLLVTGIASAQDVNPDKVKPSDNIEVGEIEKQGFLDKALQALAFVPAEDKEVVNNEQIEIPFEVTTTETSIASSDYYFYVEIYNCETSDCLDQTLIDTQTVGNSFGYFTDGTTFSSDIDYTVPSNLDGEFAVNTYIWDDADREIASTISVTQYTVVDPDSGEDNIDGDDDGVLDSNDECPDTYGEKENGCPIETQKDSDGDGTVNSEDACRYTFGSGPEGCPVDSDGDGVNDQYDKCEDRPGPASNNGCPTGGDGGNQLNIAAIAAVVVGLTLIAFYGYRRGS